MARQERRQAGPIAGFIHGIDKLDADYTGGPPRADVRYNLTDPYFYRNPKTLSHREAVGTYYFPVVPMNVMWVVTAFSMSNENRGCRPYGVIWNTQTNTYIEHGVCPAAVATFDRVDVLQHMATSVTALVLAPGERLGGEDRTFVAGDPVNWEIRYYEVEI